MHRGIYTFGWGIFFGKTGRVKHPSIPFYSAYTVIGLVGWRVVRPRVPEGGGYIYFAVE